MHPFINLHNTKFSDTSTYEVDCSLTFGFSFFIIRWLKQKSPARMSGVNYPVKDNVRIQLHNICILIPGVRTVS